MYNINKDELSNGETVNYSLFDKFKFVDNFTKSVINHKDLFHNMQTNDQVK